MKFFVLKKESGQDKIVNLEKIETLGRTDNEDSVYPLQSQYYIWIKMSGSYEHWAYDTKQERDSDFDEMLNAISK